MPKTNYKKIEKTILGHSHNPQIAKGTYQVGTSIPLDLGYNNFRTWRHSQKVRKEAIYRELYGGLPKHPLPRRREAIEHTRNLNEAGD